MKKHEGLWVACLVVVMAAIVLLPVAIGAGKIDVLMGGVFREDDAADLTNDITVLEADVDALEGRTGVWNTASTDATAGTNYIATNAVDAQLTALENRSNTWNTASTDATAGTNYISTNTIAAQLAALEGRTGTWNTAATDAGQATTDISVLESRTNDWNSAAVMPETAMVFAWSGNVTTGNTARSTQGASATSFFATQYQGSPADNDATEYDFSLATGVYNVNFTYQRGNNRAIVDVVVDGTLVFDSLDFYNGSTAIGNAEALWTNTAAGLHTLKVIVDGKNGSSSGFFAIWSAVGFDKQ